jgi:hypothetical protein
MTNNETPPNKVSDDQVEDVLNMLFGDETTQAAAHQYCLANLEMTPEQWVRLNEDIEMFRESEEHPAYKLYWDLHSRFWITLLARAQAKMVSGY